MKILILHGPNLNMLGIRDEKHYGLQTLDEINDQLAAIAKESNIEVAFFQSNHEGALIDYLQENAGSANGILINPGALTHYGYSLRDALSDTKLPIIEVHLSNIENREEFRKMDVLLDIVTEKVTGLKEKSYTLGLKKLIKHIQKL